MLGADPSSPVALQSGHGTLGPSGAGTKPFPMQTVHVRVLIAPVPRQWAHGAYGVVTRTTPRPPQTQHVERDDMMSKGSLPRPPQNEQVTSVIIGYTASVLLYAPITMGFVRRFLSYSWSFSIRAMSSWMRFTSLKM